MGKRAPILPEGYNPVGEALKKAITPERLLAEAKQKVPDNNVLNLRNDERPAEEMQTRAHVSLPALRARDPIPEVPTDKELKNSSYRFRCTESERKKWHSMAQELTGEHSQLAHFARAAFILFESAFDELNKSAPDIRRLKYPAKTDQLGLAIYEQRLAEILFDAIKASGRPRGSM